MPGCIPLRSYENSIQNCDISHCTASVSLVILQVGRMASASLAKTYSALLCAAKELYGKESSVLEELEGWRTEALTRCGKS